MTSGSYGWADDELVPVEDGREAIHAFDEPLECPRWSGFYWPSEDAPAHWVEHLTAEEAAEVATHAREQLIVWMAGAGLHPVPFFYRFTLAALFLREEVPAEMAKLAAGMRAGGAGRTRMERHVFSVIKPAEPWKRTKDLVEWALNDATHRGRYGMVREDRSLADLLEWIAAEALVVPDSVDEEAFCDDVREVARGAMRLECRWLLGAGAGTLQILQRAYAQIFYRYKTVGQGMTGHDLSALVRQCRGTFCEETSRWFEEPGEILLGHRPKSSSGQKSADCSDVYADNARKHCPRRQLAGTAGLDQETRAAAADQEQAAKSNAEAAAARIADDWEKAHAWISFLGDARERKARFGELTEFQRECIRKIREREARAFSASGGEGEGETGRTGGAAGDGRSKAESMGAAE